MLLFADAAEIRDKDEAARQVALEYLAEAWLSAEQDGVETESIAHAALFAALATLVNRFGEEAIADLIAELPERVRMGEYSLDRTLQ